MLIKRKKKAQSTLEYAGLVALVIGAVISMQVYVKRGVQGRLKQNADDIGQQYSPGYTTGVVTTTIDSDTTETVSDGVTTTQTNNMQQEVVSDMTISDLSQEYWPGSE